MAQTKHKLAQQIQWIDPSGQRMLLATSPGDELHVTIEHGAVEIQGTNCLLTEFGMPSSVPDVKTHKEYIHITIPLLSCRIDWESP